MGKYDYKKTIRKTAIILILVSLPFIMPFDSFDSIPQELYPVVGVAIIDYLKHR